MSGFFLMAIIYSIWKFLGQGLNPSHSCRNGIPFKPLCLSGDQTQASAATSLLPVRFLTCCSTVGTPMNEYFWRKKWIMAKNSKREQNTDCKETQHWAWEDKSLKLVLQWIICQLNANFETQDSLMNLLTVHWVVRLCKALSMSCLFNPHHNLYEGTTIPLHSWSNLVSDNLRN